MNAATTVPMGDGRDSMSEARALRIAWLSWLIMLIVPFVLFMIVVWYLTWISKSPPAATLSQVWFLAASLYLILAVPGALFWRGHVFRAYWDGVAVAPRNYVNGMLTVWVALEIGGIFSLVGCMVTQSLLPCLLPALAAFMFYVPLWPNGHAMTRPVGNTDDHAIYEEPR